MKITRPKYYTNFKCIADKCEDTCCKGWEIIIDKDTLKKYKNNKSTFAKKLNSKIIFYEDNEPGFKLEGENCPFLNNNNLCDIYINLGEDNLCNTCKAFPRIIEQYGNLKEISLSLGCPEACRILLLQKDKIKFETFENNDSITSYNNIDFQMFSLIISARNVAMNIIRDRSISLDKRIYLYLIFTKEVQDSIDNLEVSKIAEIGQNFKNEDYINNLLGKINKYKNKEKEKYNVLHKIIDSFKDLETINGCWTEKLQWVYDTFYNTETELQYFIDNHKMFMEYYEDKFYEYENILIYFTFRYFMKCLNDCNLLSKVILSIFSLLVIIELDVSKWVNNNKRLEFEDQVDIVHIFSKEVEHCEDNIIKLYEMFENNNEYNIDNLLNVILN